MAKGSGSGTAVVATTTSIGGGMFSTGKKAKQHVDIDCTPEAALFVTAGLIGITLLLHLLSRLLK
ncbi:hypothetical protein TVAG_419940 [Trichomonas vaginalis G3]|uniref:Uncharacterized protein n=1 Tax=Trichomonas vaginalis (strain ATCC PRA-98 / G3) TaxID=412133 RepID=A2GAH6_TRIV3|nr:hypothetical protein TVAGG3_0803890 [Trichomonas vaginalis G3]EAX85842.1 hypothetical protein TVAG_419940 [Trichomonas vaginalis G3]KAI5496712.1 hypothetical protein TVAGG3_0803890 [Trichomonas vaginalis G3]|eukprot:XP_001298772.1 hypothetical protein [Trichomonas vaginalis G3]